MIVRAYGKQLDVLTQPRTIGELLTIKQFGIVSLLDYLTASEIPYSRAPATESQVRRRSKRLARLVQRSRAVGIPKSFIALIRASVRWCAN